MRRLALGAMVMAGWACGAEEAETSGLVGAAGGTVLGPDGAKVVIPPGALTTDTAIHVDRSSASATALPAGLSAIGEMFAFTPHGTSFLVPVTLTVPFDPARVHAGVTLGLYKTNAQNQWARVANPTFDVDTVSAQVTSFSDVQAVVEPLTRNDPVREWSFSEYRGDALTEVLVDSGVQVGGFLSEYYDLGPAFNDSGYVFDDGTELPADGIATADVGSSENGVTYWVDSEAPRGSANVPNAPIGAITRLKQTQSFIKQTEDASLKFTLSLAGIVADDNNAVLGRSCPPVHAQGLLCELIKGELRLDVRADTATRSFFHTAGGATLSGYAENWNSEVWNYRFSRTPLWAPEDFDFVAEFGEGGEKEAHVSMDLRSPRTYSVDLSSVGVGEEFTLTVETFASTYNRIGGAPSEFPTSAGAYLRDPLEIGGATLTMTGLEATNNPLSVLPADAPVPPAPCVPGPGPDPAAGTLQFSAAGYTLEESNVTPRITVTRTGGSKGAVTATFTSSDGTALAGTDYTPVNATVFFADGDAAPRVVDVPLIPDLIDEPDKTVNLTLSQPGGCAALGAQPTAVLTIRNDDITPATLFTVGGTVHGLIGTLVLENHRGMFLEIFDDGPFTFSLLPTPSGTPYFVRVFNQPRDPIQVCTVTNGSGTFTDHNVTDVLVTCGQ